MTRLLIKSGSAVSLIFLVLASHPVFSLTKSQSPAGQVKFFNQADSDFDQFTAHPDSAQQNWMREHYARMLVYAPYFDSRLSWFANGLVYVDSYAIYEHSALAGEHPEWILRDAQGQKLYIPWNCQHGRCDQFAGDFSNHEFKQYMINNMRVLLSKGYRGLWLDDVNMTWRVSDGNGTQVLPADKNTGKAMTLNNWQRYFAEYMEAVREAFPGAEIAHNAIWHADTMTEENPYITRQIKAADYINLERGGSDAGLVNGGGQWGFQTFLSYIDYVHKQGADVILMDYGSTDTDREYGLATWFLISSGKDLMSSNQLAWTAPTSWWPGYHVNLGQAVGERYEWQGLLRRDFECGFVLLNQPNKPTNSVSLGGGYKNLQGDAIKQIDLHEKLAAVLLKTCAQSH
ncbi:MAG: putative glycoside hydrolase [Methylococcales bacterium]